MKVGTGRSWLLRGADGLNRRGRRRERQFVPVHSGNPKEFKLREENECRRDYPWNRLAMQMSHGKLATTNIQTMPNRRAKPIKTPELIIVMLHDVLGLQLFRGF